MENGTTITKKVSQEEFEKIKDYFTKTGKIVLELDNLSIAVLQHYLRYYKQNSDLSNCINE